MVRSTIVRPRVVVDRTISPAFATQGTSSCGATYEAIQLRSICREQVKSFDLGSNIGAESKRAMSGTNPLRTVISVAVSDPESMNNVGPLQSHVTLPNTPILGSSTSALAGGINGEAGGAFYWIVAECT